MEQFDPRRLAGERLRKLIKQNYKSREEFAFICGIDVRTLSRYINEGALCDTRVIQDFANHFGVNFLDFFKEE